MQRPKAGAACAALATLALASPGLAQAKTTVNRTLAADAIGTVLINTVAGSVTVVAGARSEVVVTGTLGAGVERLDVQRQGARVDIRVVVPRAVNSMPRRDSWARLVIAVPAGSALDIATVSADVTSNGTSGAIDVRSVSGDVRIAAAPQAAGRVRVNTVSGDIQADAASLQSARLRSTSGDIRLDGRLAATGEVELETVSGDITACFPAQISGPASRSNPGRRLDARVGAGGAQLKANTLSGNIRLCDRAP